MESFADEESRLSLTDIVKALKSINDEATIVEIELPEQISEDTRERLEQVVLHFKAEAIKGTGNYVLCSCFDNKKSIDALALMSKNDFFVFKYETNYKKEDFISINVAILATDIGRDVIGFISSIKE